MKNDENRTVSHHVLLYTKWIHDEKSINGIRLEVVFMKNLIQKILEIIFLVIVILITFAINAK
jgi:hypothetical protein